MNLKYLVAGIIAVTALGISALQSPTITWEPEKIETQIFRGGLRTFEVSFTNSKDVEDAEIRIVPELEPFVTVAPATFDFVEAGLSQNITIKINISSDTPLQKFGGVIQIKSVKEKNILDKFIDKTFKGKPTKETIFAKPLPIELEVIDAENVLDLLEDIIIDEFGTLTPVVTDAGDTPQPLEGTQQLFDAFSQGSDAEVILVSVGSLNLIGTWITNKDAEEGLSDLLDELETRGVVVDGFRATLENHDLHTEGTIGAQFLMINPLWGSAFFKN